MFECSRRAVYFALQRAIGSRVRDYYDELQHLEFASRSKVEEIQSRRLEEILRHASQNVPFYKMRIKGNTVLENFPVVTKNDLTAHYTEFMTPSLLANYRQKRRLRGYSWVEVQTGGSTGKPTTVVHDKEFRDRGRATRLYSQYLCGFPFGVPYIRLWGSMKEINASKSSISARVTSLLAGERLLNAFRMSERDMERYVEKINKSRRRHLMCYVDAAEALAHYCLKVGIKVRQLDSIMACAGTVTTETRNLLESVFGGKVYNKYGSRDCGDMVCECEQGGLHIYIPNVYLEIVNSEGTAVKPGELGRILVTILGNYSFPLIRYEIGDVGSFAADPCSCGRSYPCMKTIEGRTLEFLMGTNGEYVSPVYIRHLIGVVHNKGMIRKFQFVQLSHSAYELRIEVEDGIAEEHIKRNLGDIVRDLQAVLGMNSTIKVTRMREIPISESGKFLYTMNLAREFYADTFRP